MTDTPRRSAATLAGRPPQRLGSPEALRSATDALGREEATMSCKT
jgi:hypothetical protein